MDRQLVARYFTVKFTDMFCSVATFLGILNVIQYKRTYLNGPPKKSLNPKNISQGFKLRIPI